MNLPTTEDWNKLYAVNGVFSIRNLFLESSSADKRDKYPPLFTLKPYPYKGYPSAYQVYMDSVDEFDAATKIVPNMKVWDSLKEATWFKTEANQWNFEGLEVWREHMKQRDASAAKATLQAKVASGDVTAAKAILADTKTKAPVGRKNKKTTAELASVSRIKEFKKKVGK
jgi:hypothetical protein